MPGRQTRRTLAAAVAGLTCIFGAFVGRALASSNGFVAAGVSNYSTVYSGSCNNQNQSTGGNTDATNFASTLASNGWVQAYLHVDPRVNDTDFFDPDVTGNSYDNDTLNFDPQAGTYTPGVAVSYFAGHGRGTPANFMTTSCRLDSDCPAAPSGYFGPGVCTYCPTGAAGHSNCLGTSDPGLNAGACSYAWHVGAVVHGPNCHHSNSIAWGAPGVGVVFGESLESGGFYAGALENGGTNLAVFYQSFGGTPGLWPSETQDVFGGLHMLAMTSPTSGDTTVQGAYDSLGAIFAATASNPASIVADDFVSSIANVTVAVEGCPPGDSNPQNALGSFEGCGCYSVISWDATPTYAAWHITNESWYDLQFDVYDATGNGYFYWLAQCNYDPTTYPFSNP
jgi:hypothetical protein